MMFAIFLLKINWFNRLDNLFFSKKSNATNVSTKRSNETMDPIETKQQIVLKIKSVLTKLDDSDNEGIKKLK